MDMRGILHLDVVCLTEVFKSLTPLDLCSIRQSCVKLRDFVDVHFRSLYFARELSLDLRGESIGNVDRILSNFGRFVRRLEVGGNVRGKLRGASNLMLDVIATNCIAMLKGLSLDRVYDYEIDMQKLVGVLDTLEMLELSLPCGDPKYIEKFLLGHEYRHLTTLRITCCSAVGSEVIKTFFMQKRNIKELRCWWISGETLPLIVLNAAEIEELHIKLNVDRNLMLLAQLGQLKRLQIGCRWFYQYEIVIALVKEFSINNILEMLGLGVYYDHLPDELLDALSNLTNLKELRIMKGIFTVNDSRSIELLGQKLSKLESLMLVDCLDFPYRKFLASACGSDKFRKLYVCDLDFDEINNFIEELVKDFSNGRRRHRCFVSGNPLKIYLNEKTSRNMEVFLTQEDLQSIENYGNIKILRADDHVFDVFL